MLNNFLDDFLLYLTIERQYSHNTIESYQNDLEPYIQYLIETNKELNLEQHEINEYVTILNKKFSRRTVARKVSAIKSFYKFLINEDKIATAYWISFKYQQKTPKIPNYLTKEEINLILNSFTENTLIEKRNKVMFELLYATGMRVSELVNLELENLISNERLIKIRGKGNKERYVPFSVKVGLLLENYLKITRPHFLKESTSILFMNKNGKKMTRQGFYYILKKHCQKIGIYEISPHLLRHSIATHLIINGADIRIVQELLGHSSISTTQIYTNIENDDINKKYQKSHPLGDEFKGEE